MPTMQSCVTLLLLGLRLGVPVFAQDQQVQFNQVINLNGDMQLNKLNFPDGSRIEAFSQTQRQILVNQNPAPLSASHVAGSTGQPFVQLSQTSMTIATNNATDLVGAQIEMPIPQNVLDQNGVSSDNTFVAMLSPDRQTWIVQEEIKSVNTTDSTVRMVKLNSIDGEYIVIGRKTPETAVVLSSFSSDPNQSVKINGSGIQEVEFTDGFRMTVKASQPMAINTDVVNGISTSMLTGSTMSVNNYRYLVTTNLAAVQPNLNNMMAVVQLPLNAQRLMDMAQRMGAGPNDQISLGIEQRAVIPNPGGATGNLQPAQKRQNRVSTTTDGAAAPTDAAPVDAAPVDGGNSTSTSTGTPADATPPPQDQNPPAQDQNPPQGQDQQNPPTPSQNQGGNPAATQLLLAQTFTPVTSRTVLDRQNGRIAATVSQLDGEFIVTMAIGGRNPQQPPQQGQQPPQQGQQPAQGQTPTQTLPASNGSLPGVPTPISSPLPGSPTKRQLAPPTVPNFVVMSMAELSLMADVQKRGDRLPASAMMEEFMESQGRAIPAPAPAPPAPLARSPPIVKERSPVAKNVRAMRFSA